MALNFNVSPYYDDFDPKKQFYRVLFKPGYAVQARELTQSQSILSNQIDSFAKNIFQEGSLVTGAAHQLDDSVFFLKVQPTYNSGSSIVLVDFTEFEGNYLVELDTGKIGYIKKYTAATATNDPDTLHVSVVSGDQTPFNNSSTFILVNNKNSVVPLQHFTSVTTSASGKALLFHVSEGVFYTKGNFVYCPDQTVVVGKYTNTPDAVIGLNVAENIVDYTDDSSLLDPALGASNYLAPGADRYQITLELATQVYTQVAASYPNFIQLTTVVGGVVTTDVQTPLYSEIMDTMAKRTYDINGNFIVKNFVPNVVNNTQDETKLILQISAGSAFVNGYEIEKISTSTLPLNKSRTTSTDTQYSINTSYGNYLYVNNLSGGLPDVNNSFEVEIHSVSTSEIVDATTKIGTGLVRALEYSDGASTGANYKLFFDFTDMTSGTFGSARGFITPTTDGNYNSIKFAADVSNSSLTSKGQAQLFFSDSNATVFELPRGYVKQLNNITYYYNQHFNRSVSSNTVTIQCNSTSGSESFASGSASGLDVIENYIAVVNDTGAYIPLDTAVVTVSPSTPYSAIIDFKTNAYNGLSVDIIAKVRTVNDSPRVKTSVKNYFPVNPLEITDTSSHNLLKSDIFQLNAVYEFPENCTFKGTWASASIYYINDVVIYQGVGYISTASGSNNTPSSGTQSQWVALTNNVSFYKLDNGQRDTHYDHGSISRVALPSSNLLAIPVFDYFTHTGVGPVTPQSYDLTDYATIPTYKSQVTGKTYDLKNALDFRPRRSDDEVSTFTLSTHHLPTTDVNAIADINYYLGRVDAVVLTRAGLFKVIEGIPSYVNPVAPATQSDSITLFLLTYTPYTDTNKDVTIQTVPHKRYTMKDISSLDERLVRMEYYTALSFLESQVHSQTLLSTNGTTLFKNGYIVDSFTGSGVGDVNSPEYRASIDYTNNLARPLYLTNSVRLNYLKELSDTTLSGVAPLSSLITVPYTKEVFVNQPIASGSISANPFNVVSFVGSMKITPESDVWFDVETPPTIVNNNNGENDNYNYTSIETQYNAWQSIWTGEPINQIANASMPLASTSTAKSAPGVTSSTSNYVVNQSVVPYARKKRIEFKVDGLAPNVKLYLYINGLNMSSYLYPINIASDFSQNYVKTDDSGSASGFIMFPNDKYIKFLCGKQNIVICDNGVSLGQATSYAQSFFYSQGLLETLSSSLVSTKPNSYVTTALQLNTGTNSNAANTLNQNSLTAVNRPNAVYNLVSSWSKINEGGYVDFQFTTQNVPPGRYYTANISGTITNTDLGNGLTLGNTTIRAVGTQVASKALLHVPINSGAIVNYQNKYLELRVDVPEDEFGPAASYYSNVLVQSASTPTYKIDANTSITAGQTIFSTFTGSNLPENQTISYVVTGATANVTANVGGLSGTFTINSPTSANTLQFTIDPTYVTRGTDYDFLNVQYTLPDGTIRNSVCTIGAVKTYKLSSSVDTQVAGNTFTVTLNTTNVANGTNVPYVITGVTQPQLAGHALTGNFTVDGSGANTLTFTTSAGQFSTANTFALTLQSVNPKVECDVNITKVELAPIGVTLPASTNIGDQFQIVVTGGPSNGYFTMDNITTNNLFLNGIKYGLDVNGNGTITYNGSSADGPGTFSIRFNFVGTFADGSTKQTVTRSITFVAVPGKLAVSGPSTVTISSATQTVNYTVSSTHFPSGTTVSWKLDNPNGLWIDAAASGNSGTVNVTGSPDYAQYVYENAEIATYYNDCVNGGLTYATNYPRNPWSITVAVQQDDWIKGLRGNAIIKNGYNGKTGVAAFGQWVYDSTNGYYGVPPKSSSINGTMTVSDSKPGTIALVLHAENGAAKTSSISIYVDGSSTTTNISDTSQSLAIQPFVPAKAAKVGDFVDSSLTVAQAIDKYTYVTDGKTADQVWADFANSGGKMWLSAAQKSDATTYVGPLVKGWYSNPAYLNRNPDLSGFVYWVNQIYTNMWAQTSTSPALYNVSNGVADSFCQAYSVWVNPGTDVLAGKTQTIYRNLKLADLFPSQVGQMKKLTFVIGCDDLATLYLDNNQVVSHSSASWANGVYKNMVTMNVVVSNHTLRIDMLNAGNASIPWSQNPAFVSAAIYDGDLTGVDPMTRTPIWDTRSKSAAETVYIGAGLSETDAINKVFAEFKVAASGAGEGFGSRTSFQACTTDPLSQTFYVPEGAYPNGVFLTGVSLYFSAVDESLPVFVQIRPTVNGYPSADTVVPLSTVWKKPSEINISPDASTETYFQFSDPVYLLPGQYAIVVGSNSNKYKVYYATVGEKQLGSTNIVAAQPNVGVLFESKNASTWVADESSDLTFKLYKAKFDTGNTYTAMFSTDAPDRLFYFDTVDITTQELDFNNTTNLSYEIKNQVDGVQDVGYTSILANQNHILPATRNIGAIGDTVVKATLSTNDPNVSPVIDTDRMSLIAIENIISAKSQQTIPETNPAGGNAAAKYVTKPVTLANGFDADNISVFFDANMQSGSSIEVYAKVMASDDNDLFDNKPWVQIQNVSTSTTYSSSYNDYMEQEYTWNNVSYTSGGVEHNNFQTYAIKVVMYSNDATIVPQIKNFRAIATS